MAAPKEDSRCVPGARCAYEDPARELHTGALCERYGLAHRAPGWNPVFHTRVEPCVPHTSPDFSHRAPVPAPRAIWTPGVSFLAPVFLCRVPASTCVPLQSPCKHLCSFAESLQAPAFLCRVPASTCVPLQSLSYRRANRANRDSAGVSSLHTYLALPCGQTARSWARCYLAHRASTDALNDLTCNRRQELAALQKVQSRTELETGKRTSQMPGQDRNGTIIYLATDNLVVTFAESVTGHGRL
jgi:hypothetical protein